MGVINGGYSEFRLWITLLMAGSVSNIDQEHEGQDVYCFSLSLSLSLSLSFSFSTRAHIYVWRCYAMQGLENDCQYHFEV